MKTKIFLMLTFFSAILIAQNQVTIYNENFSLIRTTLDLELGKGFQEYDMDDIPIMIEANSVIIKPLKDGLEIFSQNYEYDLANSNKILQKYIGKEIEVVSKTDDKFLGQLQFVDGSTVGILEKTTNKLILVKSAEIRNFNLAELPDNFYLKPTLHWKLITKKAGKYPIDLSYICRGMSWEVTYNAVWNDTKNEMGINSWVTITNETGKAFADTKLKLIAGDVQKLKKRYGEHLDTRMSFTLESEGKGVPSFEEKSFHDFHLYTLSDKVSINNNQTKQITLFPTAIAKANSRYEYQTYTDKIASKIEFKNSEVDGLGMPLPKGIVKIYKLDEADDNLEFIGEDRIDHTAAEEKVTLTTGYAFDLIGETEVTDTRKISRTISEKDIVVTLKNRSKETKTINVIHYISGDWEILKNNVPFKKEKANQIEFEKTLKPGTTFEITWTERIEY